MKLVYTVLVLAALVYAERHLIEPRLTGARLSALVQAALVYKVLVYQEWIRPGDTSSPIHNNLEQAVADSPVCFTCRQSTALSRHVLNRLQFFSALLMCVSFDIVTIGLFTQRQTLTPHIQRCDTDHVRSVLAAIEKEECKC